MNGKRASITVVVADDHPVVLRGVVAVLETQPHVKIVAICNDGIAAERAIKEHVPDVAVLDIAMGAFDGIDVLSSLKANGVATRVIFLTAVATTTQVLKAMELGARGIVLKETAVNELVRCVVAVAEGGLWLPAE